VDTTLLATTANRDLQAQGVGGRLAHQHWEQIAGHLRRSLSPRHAALFAEPNADPARGTIDWFGPAGRSAPTPLPAAPPEQRAAAEAALGRLVAEIRAEAERLAAAPGEGERFLGQIIGLALEIPGLEAVWLVDGAPVLTAWGHLAAGPAALRELLIRLVPAPAAPMAIHAPAAAPAAARPAIWPWLAAFLALLVLLLALLWLLWRDPFGWFATPNPACSANMAEIAALQRLAEAEARQGVLRDELARIVAEAGRRRLDCPPPPAPTAPTPPTTTPATPPGTPPPTPPPPNSDVDRANREGARQGRVQIILAWDDRNDLDLAVQCPNGRVISFRDRANCGGVLDIDQNAGQPLTRTPVENIVFENQPPPGRYRVVVDYFQRHDRPTSPYRVTIRQEGQPDQVISGTAREGARDVVVGEFTVPAR
jgi:hypothetical protein